jgi:hypothetical protein
MNAWVRRHRCGPADRGSAMILAMTLILLVTVLVGTSVSLGIADLHGSSQAQDAGVALDAAEAGVAQAISFVRANGTRTIRCQPGCANPWSSASPVSADVKGGGHWSAWMKPLSVGNGNDGDRYLVHSTGTAGGPAQRILETEITVTPFGLPQALFGRTINVGGTADMSAISMFSTGCVYKRDHVTTANSVDLAYNVPAAVHSSQIITTSQGSGQYCPSTNKPIHGGLNALGVSLTPCNASYPYDQDRFGGSLVGSLNPVCSLLANNPAYPQYLPRDINLDGKLDVNGSYLADDTALFKSFGITRPALTAAQIDQLRITAQGQGNYYTSPNGWNLPTAAHSVLFFDLATSDTVDLDPLKNTVWARTNLTADSALCLDTSLLVVITGGNAKLNANTNLAAAIYDSGTAPGGQIMKSNGTSYHIGMLYGDTLDLTGNMYASLDTCYLNNQSPALFSVEPGTYRELDR